VQFGPPLVLGIEYADRQPADDHEASWLQADIRKKDIQSSEVSHITTKELPNLMDQVLSILTRDFSSIHGALPSLSTSTLLSFRFTDSRPPLDKLLCA